MRRTQLMVLTSTPEHRLKKNPFKSPEHKINLILLMALTLATNFIWARGLAFQVSITGQIKLLPNHFRDSLFLTICSMRLTILKDQESMQRSGPLYDQRSLCNLDCP